MLEFNSNDFSATQKSSSIIVNQTYSYINNTGFYALANPVYYDYYYRFARQYAWWYDNYVPDFHNANQGYFATGLAHTLVDGIANLICGAEIKLKNAGKSCDKIKANESLKSAYSWASDCDFTGTLRRAVKYAGALGTSLLKANVRKGSEIWTQALRLDDFFFESDFDGTLKDVVCLIKSYTDTRPSNIKWADNYGEENHQECLSHKYYLVEHRYFKEITELVNGKVKEHRVPYVRYAIHKYSGSITNVQSWNMGLQEEMDFDSVPKNIRKSIAREFSTINLRDKDREERLPFFESLGCELIRYNSDDGSLSQQPFGQSILAYIKSDLMNYDLAFSYAVRDMYQGKGTVFLPKELQTAMSGMNTFTGLEDSIINWVNTIDGDKLPMAQVQFNLRVAEWREKQSSIYETIAVKLNISPSSIAGFLTDNTARTAKEVSTESGQTDNYIDIQRGCISPAINRFLKTIGLFYGWCDTVEVRFAKSGSQNIDTIIDRVIKLKNAGLVTDYEALKMINIDDDEWEIEDKYEKLKAFNEERERKQAQMSFGMDFSNDTRIE